jgi:uncharacterized protein (UPF0335 family)
MRRTAQELREQLRQLRAHLAILQQDNRHLQQQVKDILATAEALCEDAQRSRRRVDATDVPPEPA